MATDHRKKLIRTPQDLLSLPGYRATVDPKTEPLKAIFSHYFLRADVQCGLADCHTWHKEGYVVELVGGGLTNVGHVCGKHFGDRFYSERDIYRENILRPRLIAKVGAERNRVLGQQRQIADLATRVRILVSRRMGLKKKFPELTAELNRRANLSQPDVFEEAERPKDEIDNLIALNPGSSREKFRYQQILVGSIAGIRFLTADAARVVLDELSAQSEAFLATSAFKDVSIERLIEWDSWLDNFNERLKESDRIVMDGEAFFNQTNLHFLAAIARSRVEREAIVTIDPANLEWTQPPPGQPALEGEPPPSNRRERRRQAGISWPSKIR